MCAEDAQVTLAIEERVTNPETRQKRTKQHKTQNTPKPNPKRTESRVRNSSRLCQLVDSIFEELPRVPKASNTLTMSSLDLSGCKN